MNVSTGWVGRVGDRGAVVGAVLAGGEDEHVVAMDMHGMGNRGFVFDHDADACVGAEIVHVPFWWKSVRVVAVIGEIEDWTVVVGTE